MTKFDKVFCKVLFVLFIVTFIGSYVNETCEAICFPTAVALFIATMARGNIEVSTKDSKEDTPIGKD